MSVDHTHIGVLPTYFTPFSLSLSPQYNAEAEEEQAQAKKQAKLDKLEREWKAEQQRTSSWWFQKWLPLPTSFPSNVVANLQVGMVC